MRPVLALLGGIAISITGLGIVLDTTLEPAGVALIMGGVAVAAQGMHAGSAGSPGGVSRAAGEGAGRASIVGWPSGLGPRLGRRGSARPKAD